MILLSALALTLCAPGPRYNCVVDGDTFWLAGEKIRITDIDTPETDQAKCPAERAAGERAKRRLLELLNAEPYRIRRTGTDRYGRTLSVVTNRRGSIGDQLVREGLARPYAGGRKPWC
jgi:endonuclease YncB( thermonuclease family)